MFHTTPFCKNCLDDNQSQFTEANNLLRSYMQPRIFTATYLSFAIERTLSTVIKLIFKIG